MRRDLLFLASLLVMLGGCATLVHGPYQEVTVDSTPPGATATVTAMLSQRGPNFLDPKKQYKVTTPATLRLRRDNTYRVELEKPGYKIGSTQVVSAYDWLWVPYLCGPCEAAGELPTFDMKDKPLALRFVQAAFYEYPKGFLNAFGRATRIFNPEAHLGNSFRLKPAGGGVFTNADALGTPRVSATLEPTG
jgi:hypothetical protein